MGDFLIVCFKRIVFDTFFCENDLYKAQVKTEQL